MFAFFGAGIGLYILLPVILIIMGILIEFEKEGWATTIFSIGLTLILWNHRNDIWDFISQKPWSVFWYSLSYMGAGLLWSLIKWQRYIKKYINVYITFKKDFIKIFPKTDIGSMEYNKLFEQKYTEHYEYENFNGLTEEQILNKIIPAASSKKSLIISWISYWPVTLIFTLLNDPFRHLFEAIYTVFSGVYDKIGNYYKNKILNNH